MNDFIYGIKLGAGVLFMFLALTWNVWSLLLRLRIATPYDKCDEFALFGLSALAISAIVLPLEKNE